MSEAEQSKSEQATPYRLEQARKKGMVAKSAELGALAAMGAATAFLAIKGNDLTARLVRASERMLVAAGSIDGGGIVSRYGLGRLMYATIGAIGLLLAIIFFVVAIAMLLQTGFVFAPSALKPDLGRLNPAKGIKRLFSRQTLVDAGKAAFKLAVYAVVAVTIVGDYVRTLAGADLAPDGIAPILGGAALRLVVALLIVAAGFAAIDQVIARRMFARQMRMSRHELKQEFKQREGDPRIKQRRKQLQRELLKRAASAQGVRQADVVITNPTHYLVGLRYQRERMGAPQVVAKGEGEFAQRLRQIAFLHGVPIVQSPSLARKLYFQVQQEAEIPGDLFKPVAEVYLRLRAGRHARGAGGPSAE